MSDLPARSPAARAIWTRGTIESGRYHRRAGPDEDRRWPQHLRGTAGEGERRSPHHRYVTRHPRTRAHLYNDVLGHPLRDGLPQATRNSQREGALPLNKSAFLYIASYATDDDARADYEAVKQLHREGVIGTYDAAIITKDATGKVHVTKHEKPTQHGAWTGLAVGAVIADSSRPSSCGMPRSAREPAHCSVISGEACHAAT